MKYKNLKVIRVLEQSTRIMTILGVLGVLGLIVGQVFFLAGATGKIAIKMETTLKAQETLLKKAIRLGGVSIGVAIILMSSSRRTCQEKAESELHREEVLTATMATPIACEGCKQYHGILYNNVPFVCAMYPYGHQDNECPDWEEKS
ncbi:hypothetical protein F7734_18565 [Scytonema sp. UIC 10036]|nr:hypothetical protein [Scytonema sp. UIC 10036]